MCASPLADAGGSARCPEGHSFDYARSGYLNLTRRSGGRGRVGDTAEMVRARAEFLATGHYEPIAAAVRAAAVEAVCGPEEAAGEAAAGAAEATARATVVAEVGSGTGYYLDAVVRALRERGSGPGCGFGFDLSKAAAAHAARRHPDLRFVVADVEEAIPLRDSAADLVLSAFAPRPGPELGRVTRPGGGLVVALAGPRHLERLRERLTLIGIQEDKLDRLTERLEPWFDLAGAATVEYEIALSEDDARRLALMGPSAHHDPDLTALAGEHTDLVSVTVARFRRGVDQQSRSSSAS
ncbi:MAG: methyltransferase domain-containing protein [Solirubrobacterales bacterium]